jgi:hypothetical protein
MKDAIIDARAIFLNAKGEARCGWRIAIFFCAVFAAGIFLNVLLGVLITFLHSISKSAPETSIPEIVSLAGAKLITFLSAVAATAFCAPVLERRSLASVGFQLHRGWLRDFALGSAIGAVSIAAAVGIIFARGAVKFEVQSDRSISLAVALIAAFLFMLMSAATEELLFRGFAFQALAHDLGPVAAVAGTSILFGLLHLPNPSSTLFSTINTVLAGVWLSLAYLLTRSLWLATALHYSWNFAQSVIFGLPLSGLTTFDKLSWLKGTIGPPRWLSGLEYGPEGGVAATITLILSIALIWKAGLFSVTEEMQTAVRHQSREHGP